ncbi:M20/M25/M40 family metallo-hydrolase [Henriciella litoralis]|uniref:M20/M25/M40 family metallo-hydrolase n=1 Tax=Henriciella litoralis TaxID=568102 RepID=UPI000A01D09B|nr:M20/M25/M40 family metallo-hydrolase [Henriciella litoralis]
MAYRFSLLAGAAFLAATPFAAAQERTPDELKAREIYSNVIAIRSARGQGRVHEVVDYLKGELKDAGFADADMEVTDYDNKGEPTQGLMVWYRSENPEHEPIVLLAHMDVVDALAEDWVRDPFTLTEEEGYFFGRGTADNKYGVTNLVQTFIRLKKEGWQPNRDIVMVLSGDEETGMVSTRGQAEYVDENIKPAFILNADAGGLSLGPAGEPLYYGVQGAEKTYATFELTVTNPGGHSSTPREDNAIYELSEALLKIRDHKFPVMSSELTRASMRVGGRQRLDGLGKAMRDFADDPTNEEAIEVLRANPSTVGTIGTTCVATMLRGGHAENALPQSATATVNCRIFPGVGIDATEETLKEVIGNEDVKFELISDLVESPESILREDVTEAIKVSLADRGLDVPILPHMSSGGTDGMHYRNLGYDTVAISAAAAKQNDTFAHGLNERLPVKSFYDGLDHWSIILKELAGDKTAD